MCMGFVQKGCWVEEVKGSYRNKEFQLLIICHCFQEEEICISEVSAILSVLAEILHTRSRDKNTQCIWSQLLSVSFHKDDDTYCFNEDFSKLMGISTCSIKLIQQLPVIHKSGHQVHVCMK